MTRNPIVIASLIVGLPLLVCRSHAQTASTVCLAEDNQTCLNLSPASALELTKGHNSYGDDVEISLHRVAREETDKTLRSVQISARKTSTGEIIHHFVFLNPVTLSLGRWCLFERMLSGARTLSASTDPFTAVSDPREWIGLYWDNGIEFVRIDGVRISADQSLSIAIQNTGHYKVMVARSPSTLTLAGGSPYPRIITPNRSSNRRVFFVLNSSGHEPFTGSIYDFRGAKVRDLSIDHLSPTSNTLVWDGKDMGGEVVPSGPYLYKITSGDQHLSGGLVVAR